MLIKYFKAVCFWVSYLHKQNSHAQHQLTDDYKNPQEEEHSSEDQTANPHRLVV